MGKRRGGKPKQDHSDIYSEGIGYFSILPGIYPKTGGETATADHEVSRVQNTEGSSGCSSEKKTEAVNASVF